MRVLALACLGFTAASCGGAGIFACMDSSECGTGVCEANGYCSFADDACPSMQRYGEHAPDGIAGACVEPTVDPTSTTSPDDTNATSTSGPVSLTIATLESTVGSSSSGDADSSSSSGPPTSATSSVDDGESSSSGEPATVIGPIEIVDNLDDGAIHVGDFMDIPQWLPSGEAPGLGFTGEFPEGERYFAYLRFELPDALPAGTVIENATLELFGHATYYWDRQHALRVFVQDSADANQVSGALDYPSPMGTVLRDESVHWGDADDSGLTWQIPGPNAATELAPLVQQLVDAHGGLEAGAHVQLWIAEDVVDGMGEEVGWLDSSAGEETTPRLTLTVR